MLTDENAWGLAVGSVVCRLAHPSALRRVGMISALEGDCHESGEGTEHLWQGVKAFAEWQLAQRKGQRSPRGTWYAWVEVMTRDRDSYTSWTCEVLEHRICKGRDAAVAASSELLAKHAGKLNQNVRIEADVCPEIEWPVHQSQHANDEDGNGMEPHSPLVHPSEIDVEFADDD